MASQSLLSSDDTFFSGTMNDTQVAAENMKDDFVNSTVICLSQEKKKQEVKKSLGKTQPKTKNTRISRSNKENVDPKNASEKKRGRPSTKREALKVLNKNPTSKSPAKPKPSPRKTNIDVKPFPRKPRSTIKEIQTKPEVVIYEDTPRGKRSSRQNAEKKSPKRRSGRENLQEKKSSKAVMSLRNKSTRHTMKDMTNLKHPKQEELKSPKIALDSNKKSRRSKIDTEGETVLAKLETIFPDVDPEYLKALFLKFKQSVSCTIDYILSKEQTEELPTRADFIKRQEIEKWQREYLENFSVENFLKIYPNPWEYFSKQEKQNCVKYKKHSFHYLKNKFKKHLTLYIKEVLIKNNYNLYRANKELQKKKHIQMRLTSRSKAECDSQKPIVHNEQFLHEVAFIENEKKIKAHIKKNKTAELEKFKRAEKAGTFLECLSCNDPSLQLDDAVNCTANHVFCKDCVVKYVIAEMNKNNFHFKCLVNCEEMLSVDTLQSVITSEAIGKVQKINQQEVKIQDIKNLVWCPFCNYVTLMPPEVTVLRCPNPDCLKESCRHCSQVNHIPLECHELEKFDICISEEEDEEDNDSTDHF